MKRIITTILLFSLLGIGNICAQNSDAKKINSIKRNDQYIYAEATMNTEDEAFQTAQDLLLTYVNEYITEKKKLDKANSVIIKDISSKCEKIQMMRGEMFRVFVYVNKKDIIPADNATTLIKLEETEETEEQTEETPSKTENPAEEKEVVPTEPVTTSDNTVPVPTDTNEAEASPLPEIWQQQTIERILTATSLESAEIIINRLKAEYKIKRYGKFNDCKDPDNCFWLVYNNKGDIITVLGLGKEKKTNFKTMKYDSLNNYSGHGAIWFTLSN